MRIPVVAGRSFEPGDDASVTPRVVISEALARQLFRSEQPIGRQIRLVGRARTADVIGVVGDIKHRALDEALMPTVYLSGLQSPSRSTLLVVRSALRNADVIAAVREEIARLDPDLPVYGIVSMDEVVARSPGVPARRVLTAAFFGFAVLAVALAGLGLFGVAAHDVSSRRVELALRIALGADPSRLMSATLGQAALMVGSGLLAGGVLSIWMARALSAMSFGINRLDVLSVGVPVAVLVVAGVAAVLPAARRAATTDPLIALRAE
jgi:ABC-type antimicrobial peptide transport system permease subunit